MKETKFLEEMPRLPKNYFKIKNRILKLKNTIQEGIDKICEDEKYKVTYAEINIALIEILKTNIEYEIKDVMKK